MSIAEVWMGHMATNPREHTAIGEASGDRCPLCTGCEGAPA